MPMRRRRRRGALLAAGAATILFAATSPAQAEPASLPGPELVKRLKQPQLPIAEAEAYAPQLASVPIALRLQGCSALRDTFLARQKAHKKACVDVQKQIAHAAEAKPPRAAKNQADAVDLARRAALAVTRRERLDKEAIHQEIDPRVDELTTLLWLGREQLLASEPHLNDALNALRHERDELQRWHQAYASSTLGLELYPDAEKYFVKAPPPPPPLPAAALDDECTIWTLLAMPLSSRDRQVLDTNEGLRATSDPEEFAGTTELNRIRWLLGLPLLRIDDKLVLAARDHSQDMVHLGFFAHESPVAGKRTPGDRAGKFGTSAHAENIAQGHGSGPEAIRGWWYSPGHHKNLLGNHATVGLGRSAQTWTQMFGG